MKRVCAWCEKSLGEISEGEASSVTHGICPSCKETMLADIAATHKRLLNRLPGAVLVMGARVEVKLANDMALQMVGKDLKGLTGLLGGDALQCLNAGLPGGCGNTEHCLDCAVRDSVTETFETGRSLQKVSAFLKRQGPGGVRKDQLLLSTEKTGAVVLLRIEEMVG